VKLSPKSEEYVDDCLAIPGTTPAPLSSEVAAPIVTGDTAANNASTATLGLDDALKQIGYDDGTRKRMMDHLARTEDPVMKKELETKLRNSGNKTAYKKRYGDKGMFPATADDIAKLDKILKDRGYSDKTRPKLIDAWKKAKDNVDREALYDKFTSPNPAIIAQNKVDYGEGGAGAPAPPPAGPACEYCIGQCAYFL
jgi:hypothetical protein